MKNAALPLLFTLAVTPLFAQAPIAPPQSRPQQQGQQESRESRPPADAKDQISTTQHSISVGGTTVNYTARAGTMILRDEEGKPRASFFFVSYTKDGVDPGKRPVTFTFNGGPGSSSVWLHMGAFGPRRVNYLDDTGNAAKPPYRLVDNEGTILDVTDLVFIDPVTTGFSRAIPLSDASKFHGVDADVQSVGEFIRLWTTRYSRWASPKYLSGESYGTTRAAGLSGWLQQQGYYLNGIILISSILNFETTSFDTANDLAYVLFLPHYTATAWYHKQLPAELQNGTLDNAIAKSKTYALGPYAAALMQGDRISDAERRAVAAQLATFTGLPATFIERANLRVSLGRFDKELLRDERRTVGRLDSRFTGIDRDAVGETPEFDSSYAAIFGEYTSVLNDYVRRELKFETDLPYEILTSKVRPWNYDRAQNRYVDVADTLRNAMSQNPHMKVFVANGYYDGATPFAATEYTFARLNLDPEVKKNVSMDYYEAGHMMYIHRASHLKLRKNVVDFIKSSSNVP